MCSLVRIEKEQLTDVAILEEKCYPEYLCLGYDDFLYDYESGIDISDYNYSYGIYSDSNELKGYIIAYKEYDLIYVSDLVCRNPMYLYKLLTGFKNVVKRSPITCECRESSYKLLKSIADKGYIDIFEEEFYKGYYYMKEDMWKLSFNLR